jgi:hypothetical protein
VESFPIICETCRARLKVRSTRVIGEIHACPKCGSMVQILPPVGWQTASTATSVAQVQAEVQPTPDAVAPTMEFVDVAVPAVPVAAATSPLVLWGAAGAALLLAGLAVGMWAGGRGTPDDSAPLAVAGSKAAAEQLDVRDPYAVSPAAAATNGPPRPAEPPVESVATVQPDQLPAAPELPELPTDQHASASDRAEAALKSVADQLAPTDKGESLPSAAPTTREQRQSPVLRFDPLDFDPTRLSLAGGASSAAAPSVASIDDDPAGEPEVEAPVSPDSAAADVLPPPLARDQTLHVQLGPMPSEPARSHQAVEQLALRVDSLALSEVSLVRFVEVISDMAGVPITIDPVALELAGASARAGVSVQANDATLEKLLADALSPHRLELVDREGRLDVALAGGERWRSVDYELKDLTGGVDAEDIADYVQRFVAPATWRAAGGKGILAVDGTTLHVEQTRAVHHEILIFCERLRLARGLAPRSRYPAERLSVEPPNTAIAAKLNERTTFTFLPWERFSDVVQFWQDTSELTILVDWSALGDAELGPSSPIACSTIDRRWEEVFDEILEPLGLAWWAVDRETIQITSRDRLEGIQRVEFYAIPDSLRNRFASGEALVESLETELRERVDAGRIISKAMRMEFDKPSGRLIVLAPPTVHRYLSQRLRDKSE